MRSITMGSDHTRSVSSSASTVLIAASFFVEASGQEHRKCGRRALSNRGQRVFGVVLDRECCQERVRFADRLNRTVIFRLDQTANEEVAPRLVRT